MSKTLQKITLAAVVLLVTACATTTFTSTWKAPGTGPINPVGKTVAAVFVSHDESRRRPAEDQLAADLSMHGAKGVAAYTILPDEMRENGDAARTKLKAAGCDGVVIMRVVGKDQQINYTPGMAMPASYGGFGPYWGYGWGATYSPPTITTDTIVSVETLVYSLTTDKLLWASSSRTTNPKDLDTLVGEVAAETAKEMQKQGLIVMPPK
jgi:hypothetical protein